MSLIVQKFGGTSVGDLERIAKAAVHVKRAIDDGHQVAVVVSAMSGETDRLVGLVDGVEKDLDRQEHDAIVASGEQVTAGLMALTLQKMGVPSRSWQGWQVPVITDESHSRARVQEVKPHNLNACIDAGVVPIVTGFQGVTQEGRITTLGRGGSDLSAVILAAALGAERCDIFTDVEGVFTCDPRVVAKAHKLDKITYEEMLEMASQGAKVLHTRSVATAMNHHVRLQVLSTFTGAPGTLVVDEDEIVEQKVVSGIAYSRDDAKITMVGLPDRPGVAASLFGPLADADINVDMIVQNISPDGDATDLTFTVAKGDLDKALQVIHDSNGNLGARRIEPDPDVVKVSVIGVGMRSHAGVAGSMFEALAEKGINIQLISTSEIKISVLISEDYLELALRALHTAYGLDTDE
ncbi:MAG: aspartate kinase [Alphaproteobacteria bacterium]|jgi:aspartate kinase|nr:aspartate kinase [Rhodospirillaceae bacterium]MBT6203780.1 aspartate kinase [Rhodospirillaceae bacterium]MBT6512342.1 aspartate kinase [Rhodospirillaceae bacterium]MBT7646728.1 aspartate kinase [Rhodospirillaceae bacterium]MDG2480421.1 aspartate kinase [Alphaproteobacteria bacterium]